MDEKCFPESLGSCKAELNCKCCPLGSFTLPLNTVKVARWLFCTAFLFALSFFRCVSLGFFSPRLIPTQSINIAVQFVPIFHGVNALLRLNEMGAGFFSIAPYFFNLLALGIFYTLLSLLIPYLKSLYKGKIKPHQA